jgi:hypothetical protein
MTTGVGFLSVFCLSAQCAELLLDPVFASAGLIAPIVLRFASAGSAVAALQFDLESDAPLTLTPNAGPVALSAGKELHSAPVSARRTRFVVAGLNQNVVGDGVIAAINAFVSATTTAGAYPLRLTNLSASDQAGNAVPLTAKDGSLTVSASETQLLSGVFPQLATGGGWKTSFTLLNLASTDQQASLKFWDSDGAPLSVPLAFSPEVGLPPASGVSAEVRLAANGMAVVELDSASADVTTGWAKMLAPAGIVGSATFRYRTAEGQEPEAVVPMETRKPYAFVLPYDNTAGYTVGVAVANDSDQPAAGIAIILRDAAGRELLTDTISLAARGHAYFTLTNKYPSLAGARGSMELRDLNGGSIAVLGLRFNPAGSFTSIPAEAR